MSDQDIFNLAHAAGLARDWISAAGRPMQVQPQALTRILDALGLPCASDAQCRDSRKRLDELQYSRSLPQLVTGTVNQSITLGIPPGTAGKPYRIILEDGDEAYGCFADHAARYASIPPVMRAGYHRLQVEDDETTLAIAPERCFGIAEALRFGRAIPMRRDARLWGLGVQLYALRRYGDGGVGDFTSLAELARSVAAHGASALAISPVHAMFNADLTRFSPYGPSSRLFLNAWHIDPQAVLGHAALAQALTAVDNLAAERLHQLEHNALIDWPASISLRLDLLRRLYEQFTAHGDCGELEVFRAESGSALRDHARFEVLHAWRLAHGENGDWRTWPAHWRDPRSPDVERFAQEHAHEVRFHEFLQWQAARGMAAAQKAARDAGMPIGLITDLAVGADNGGSQAWSRQSELINGLSVGAPPDVMNPHGQAWGLGAFSPQAMQARGFGATIEMLRAAFAHAGGVRIDHVLGLSRLWLVPQGESPDAGAYLQYPFQDLLRLIALESWRHHAIVIGENLGTVPAGFNHALARAGLLGIQVLLFQQDNGRFLAPAEWSGEAIATTTTHDLPTLAGWWQGRDIDWRARLHLLATGQSETDGRQGRDRERGALWRALGDAGLASGDLPPPEARDAPLDAAIEHVSATPAPLAMLPIEDALGLVEQTNLPGTVETHPNWRRRLPLPVETLLQTPEAARRMAIMNRSRFPAGAE